MQAQIVIYTVCMYVHNESLMYIKSNLTVSLNLHGNAPIYTCRNYSSILTRLIQIMIRLLQPSNLWKKLRCRLMSKNIGWKMLAGLESGSCPLTTGRCELCCLSVINWRLYSQYNLIISYIVDQFILLCMEYVCITHRKGVDWWELVPTPLPPLLF